MVSHQKNYHQELFRAFEIGDEVAAALACQRIPTGLLDQEFAGDGTPLQVATIFGYTSVVRTLLARGAAVDSVTAFGWTALLDACARSHVECARLLLEAGAHVDRANDLGYTPLFYSCMQDCTELVRLLSSYGAARTFPSGTSAEALCKIRGYQELRAWLEHTRGWGPLQHLEVLTPRRATALLRDCADVAASDAADVPSPLERAAALQRVGAAAAGSAAALVILEACGWSLSRENKQLLPAEARDRAVAVGCIGVMTSALLHGLDAVWNAHVVPRLLHAEFGHVRFAYR